MIAEGNKVVSMVTDGSHLFVLSFIYVNQSI